MEIVNQVFKKIEEANNVEDVISILLDFEKYKMSDYAYPQIGFKIEKEEIEALKKNGIITDENLLATNFEGDTLSKLLYAVLWKNGDLIKIKHIINGIVSEENDDYKESAIVFYQFGKYLTKKGNPIIDQHTLRAFGIYKANGNSIEIERFRNLSIITKKEKYLIEDYIRWLKTDLKETLRTDKDYSYYVDKVLFAVGKSLKIQKKSKSK